MDDFIIGIIKNASCCCNQKTFYTFDVFFFSIFEYNQFKYVW